VYCLDQTVDSQNRPTLARRKPVFVQTKLMIGSYSTVDMYNFGGGKNVVGGDRQ
jgi:hypothetical protein